MIKGRLSINNFFLQAKVRMSLNQLPIVFIFLLLMMCNSVVDKWQHPLKMKFDKKQVQYLVGKPQFVPPDSNIEWYPESGISVEYDDFDQLTQINFAGPTPENIDIVGTKWIPTRYKIYDDITVFLSKEQIFNKLGEPYKTEKSILTSSDSTYFWKLDNYLFEIEFWEDGNTVRTLSVRKSL